MTEDVLSGLSWLLNPASILELGFEINGLAVEGVGWLISQTSPELGQNFINFGETLQSVPLVKMWAVGTWLLSPIINPTLLNACITAMMFIWSVSIVVKFTTWVFGLIWSSPA